MSIYIDPIGESLGLKPIQEYFPDYNLNPSVPEDSIYRWGGRETGWNHTEETKELLRERSIGNTNGRTSGYALSDEFKDKRRVIMTNNNPMDNPESVAKLSTTMKVKKKCPHCDMMGNPATLARHIKARHA